MVPKKVGSITLEYDRGDGVIVSEAFDAEFNNAIFRGNISGMTGTFKGRLTANTLNAVSNLNVRGKAVAITTAVYVGTLQGIFDDDAIYRSILNINFVVPAADLSGGAYWAALTYDIADNKSDNNYFLCQYRILVDGNIYFESTPVTFWKYINMFKNFYHEIAGIATGPGTHSITLQYRWFDKKTNVYPRFDNIMGRVDYIRK